MLEVICRSVPLDLVDCAPRQVRTEFPEEELAGLTATVRQFGVMLPILVRPVGSRFLVTAGERRVRAARAAGLKEIPAVIDAGTTDDPGRTLAKQIIENCQRVGLAPMDRARALAQLIGATGWTAAMAAETLGISPASISRSLSLLDLSPELQARVASGTLSPSAAYELAQLRDEPHKQRELAEQLAAGSLTRDGARGSRLSKGSPTVATGPAAQRSRRLVLPLGAGGTVTFSGAGCPSSIEALIAALAELTNDVRRVRPQGLTLETYAEVRRDRVTTAAPTAGPTSEAKGDA